MKLPILPTAAVPLYIDSFTDIVISARGHEPGIRARGFVVRSCLRHGEAEAVGNRKPADHLPSAPYAEQIGSAVDRLPVGVHCALLRSKIADREVIDRDVTDTSGRDVTEVFFDDEPIVGDFVLWELLQQGIDFVYRGDQALSPASRSEWLLNSDFTAAQHANRCLARIASAERAVASQY